MPSGPLALDASKDWMRAATTSSVQRNSSGQKPDEHSLGSWTSGETAELKQLEK